MKSEIRFDTADSCRVRFVDSGGNTITVDGSQSFEAKHEEDQPIAVIEEPRFAPWKWYQWLLWTVLMPLHAILSVFSFGETWDKQANPFLLRCRLLPNGERPACLHYRAGRYDSAAKSFSDPKVYAENAVLSDVSFEKDRSQIRLAFLAHTRRFVSGVALLSAVLIHIAVSALSRGSTSAAVICFAVLAAFIGVAAITVVFMRGKYREAENKLAETLIDKGV